MRDQKQQNHNQQKKIALVNDFTGFGRCSIAVQLPVISMMKVQCCAVPTAIFSDHTTVVSFSLKVFINSLTILICSSEPRNPVQIP